MEPKVFISYAREDSEWVLRLANDLRGRGYPTWVDRQLSAGVRWRKEIDDALRACDVLIVVLSPESVESAEVDAEVSFAFEKDKAVIPLLHKDCDPPYYVAARQRIDFVQLPYANGLDALVTQLAMHLAPPEIEKPPQVTPEAAEELKAVQERIVNYIPLEVYWAGSTKKFLSREGTSRSAQPGDRFRHDVYISYARDDSQWASRLANDLVSAGHRCYVPDQNTDRLPSSIVHTLWGSQHLVVLWSPAAKASEFVTEEIYRFKALTEGTPDRWMIPVLLEDSAPAFLAPYKQITDLAEKGLYRGGVEAVDARTWHRVVRLVSDAIGGDAVQIPFAVLASNRERMSALAPTFRRGPFDPSLDALLAQMHLTRDRLLERYGVTPLDWQPARAVGISELLYALALVAGQALGTRVRLTDTHEAEWTNYSEFERHVLAPLSNGPALLAVDCFSFYDPYTYSLFTSLQPALKNDDLFLLAFWPNTSREVRHLAMEGAGRIGGRLSIYDTREPAPELAALIANRLAEKRDREQRTFITTGHA